MRASRGAGDAVARALLSVVEVDGPVTTPPTPQPQPGALFEAASPKPPQPRPGAHPALSEAELASTAATPAQRALLAGWLLLQLAVLAHAGGADPLVGVALFAAAWLVADLVVGVFHFAVDNYGEDDHPLVAAFQYHHHRPWCVRSLRSRPRLSAL